jgi:hypothetical protein
MTKAHLNKLHGTNQQAFGNALHDQMTADITTIMKFAGYSDGQLSSENNYEWKQNVGVIISLTLELRSAIGEGISSRELEVIIHPSGAQFDVKTMVNYVDHGRRKTSRQIDDDTPVLCTTDLGLGSWRGVAKGNGTEYKMEILLKPKVARKSIVQDALNFASGS